MRRPRVRTVLAGAAALLAVLVAVAWLVPPLGAGNAWVVSGPPGSDQGTSPSGATIIRFVPSGRVAPGEVRLLGVVGRFPDCANARPNWATGSGVTIDALRLSVQIAGLLPAGSDVPLLRAVDLLGDADAACA